EQLQVVFAHRARRLEQPQRARAWMPELPRIPFAGLDAPPAVFRAMIRMSRQAVDRVGAEARLQPLGETTPALVLRGRVAEHPCGPRVQRRKIARLEPNRSHGPGARQRSQ